jgi:hypothetical protein
MFSASTKAASGTVAATLDPQFNNVTMLLHGDGTNGAQNNTFVDSSTNNFSITRNGNTTQGSFTPYGSNWGNSFNGVANSKLSAANNAAFSLGSGDFTVECWFYLNNTSSAMCMFENRPSNTGTGINMFVNYDGAGQVQYRDSSGAPISSSITVSAGTWNHYALVRSGVTITLWINGQSGGTVNKSTNFTDTTCVLGQDQGGGFNFAGYLSNFRIVKGTAVYTSAFTPSTTPLTAITNTSILTCQSNRFFDASANNFAMTPTGTVIVERFNPFGTSTAYSTSVIGGSGYFDGAGDYLVSQSTSEMNLGTLNFCVEMWFYATSTAGNYRGLCGSQIDYKGPSISRFGTKLMYGLSSNGGSWDVLQAEGSTGTTTILANQWYHVALCRTGTTISAFVNGARDITITSSASLYARTEGFTVGAWFANLYIWLGYISGFRFVVGSSPYNATQTTITVPTSPPTAITNTKLLCNMTNGAIFDNAMMNDLETVGNANISTSVVKYGTGSLAFDGSGDYLLSPNNLNGDFGTGDFTVEYWFNCPTQSNSNVTQVGTLSSVTAANTWRFGTQLGGSAGLYFAYHTGSNFIDIVFTTTNYNNNTWNHAALTRSSGIVRAFINGTQVGSNQSITQNLTSGQKICVGAELFTPTYYTGYLDELRITKGIARYTTNFTPPSQAFFNTGPY